MSESDQSNEAEYLAAAAVVAQEVFAAWQNGNQGGALERLRPEAERGERWAVAMMSWLHVQQGPDGMLQALPWAERADALGMPWVPLNLFNTLIGNIPGNPHLVDACVRLAEMTLIPWGSGVDPVGQAWNLLANAQPAAAVRVLNLHSRLPLGTHQWQNLLNESRQQTEKLAAIVATAGQLEAQVRSAAGLSEAEIERLREEIETYAEQAKLLISSVNAGAVNALFDQEADRHQADSRWAWRGGLAVLGIAALVAVLPMLLHYFGVGPHYSGPALLGAHAGSTAALATFAGVLLSRARNRDRAHQRARDLSTAMGTMISYSNQIKDEAEKQRFMLVMGQLVLQAHLRPEGASARDDTAPNLFSLVPAVHPSAS